MPHRIDTPMKAMEPTRAGGVRHHVSGIAELIQLSGRDDTVLALR